MGVRAQEEWGRECVTFLRCVQPLTLAHCGAEKGNVQSKYCYYLSPVYSREIALLFFPDCCEGLLQQQWEWGSMNWNRYFYWLHNIPRSLREMNVGNTVSHTCQSHKAGGFLKLTLEVKRCLMEQLCRSYANRELK